MAKYSQPRLSDPAKPTAGNASGPSNAINGIPSDELEAAYFNPWEDPHHDPLIGPSNHYSINMIRPPIPAPLGEFALGNESYLRRLAEAYIEPVGRVDSGMQISDETSASSSASKGKGKARDDGTQSIDLVHHFYDDEDVYFRPRRRRNPPTGPRGRRSSIYNKEANHASSSEDVDQHYTTADEYQASTPEPPARLPPFVPELVAPPPPVPGTPARSSSSSDPPLGPMHLQDCMVCADAKPRLDFPVGPTTNACTHAVQTCTDCLSSWLASELADNGHSALACPECLTKLSYNDVRRSTTPETFATYDRLTAQAFLADQPDFAWCLQSGCGSGQLNTEHPKFKNFMKCAACGYEQCLNHRGKWHERESCEQHDYRVSGRQAIWEEMATQATLDKMSKLCPGVRCQWRLEKIDGCDQ